MNIYVAATVVCRNSHVIWVSLKPVLSCFDE